MALKCKYIQVNTILKCKPTDLILYAAVKILINKNISLPKQDVCRLTSLNRKMLHLNTFNKNLAHE